MRNDVLMAGGDLERRLYQLETLYEIGRECSRVQTAPETLQVILSMLMGAFGAARGLAFIGLAGDGIDTWQARGFGDALLPARQAAEAYLRDGDTAAACRDAGLAVWLPLDLAEPTRGVVALGPRFDDAAYSDEDRALLAQIAANACPYLEKVLLLARLHESAATLARRNQALAAVRDMALDAFQHPGLMRLYRRLADHTRAALDAELAALELDGDVVAISAPAGGQAAATMAEAASADPARALVAALGGAGGADRLLVRRGAARPPFDEADAELLALLANQGAILIENARLLEQFLLQQQEQFRLRGMLEQYLAPTVAERLISGETRAMLEGARLTITVLMIDIRGSTELINVVEPEEMVRFLNGYFGRMTDILFRFEGTVDKFSGDAVLGFFGAPERHADDPLRAVRAAIEMQRVFAALMADWRGRYALPAGLGVGIGVATGEVVVGNIGSAKHLEHTIIGSAVNLAARLSASAAAGTIQLDHATWHLVERDLPARAELHAHGPRRRRLKGFAELVPVYHLRLLGE